MKLMRGQPKAQLAQSASCSLVTLALRRRESFLAGAKCEVMNSIEHADEEVKVALLLKNRVK